MRALTKILQDHIKASHFYYSLSGKRKLKNLVTYYTTIFYLLPTTFLEIREVRPAIRTLMIDGSVPCILDAIFATLCSQLVIAPIQLKFGQFWMEYGNQVKNAEKNDPRSETTIRL